MPTKTENFGIVILEALSYGIPVLTTKAAPWTILNKKSIGWCVDDDKESIKEAIITATNLNNKELKDMGKQSRKFVELNFTWEK